MDDPGLDFVGAELLDGTGNGFDRALHVALDQKRELLELAGSCSCVIICSSEPRAVPWRAAAFSRICRWRYSVISRARLRSRPRRTVAGCGVP
jgi:hypothetical protein